MLVNYKKPNCHTISSFDGKQNACLRPGWNEIPSQLWKEHMERKDAEGKPLLGADKKPVVDAELQRMLDKGEIELLEEKVKVKGKTVVVGPSDAELDIKMLDEKKAISIVKETFNRDMLQRWIDEETRHKVKRALEEQMKPLMPEKN